MKYIRTKDGRLYCLEDLRESDLTLNPYCVKEGKEKGKCIYKHTIIKQADTIEELCDGYLCFTKSNKNWVITENYETAKLYAERGCEVNACILTDKGLIYVAKMNEKGELELL